MLESCRIHKEHSHKHGPKCGHTAVKHEGHTDYLHDGHLHHAHENHVDEHVIALDAKQPASVETHHDCGGHTSGHKHAADVGKKRFRMVTIPTIWSRDIFTIKKAENVATTDR